ncbi:MAG TPA: carbonic anhydrase [Rhodospirillaceae bacterium]|nr:carbonic anhydrase [Candidatus Neomarinimicrobiota bacterium]HCX14967.1 carbonic anhydrase [Rhodospirillaceae bacterium]
MDRLIEGYRRFRASTWPKECSRYEELAKMGQKPRSMVIACSDSRVDPQTVFDSSPGELFIIRNVAGLVPQYKPDSSYHGTSAALEFGVRVLKVKHIIVLGHARCGGVQAMVEGSPAEAKEFVEPWMKIAKKALHSQPPKNVEKLTYYETEVVRITLENLLTFPWIRDAVMAGDLNLNGFRFDVSNGTLSLLEGDQFVVVE